MDFRGQLDTFEKTNFNTLFIEDTIKDFGKCQNNLNKAQSILLKRTSPLLVQNNPTGLYQTITDVWQNATNGKNGDPEFGRLLFLENKKKDPILLFAVTEHLRRQKIGTFIAALKSGKNPEEIFNLFNSIDPKDRLDIEKYLGTPNFLDTKEFPLPETVIKKLESFLQHTS